MIFKPRSRTTPRIMTVSSYCNQEQPPCLISSNSGPAFCIFWPCFLFFLSLISSHLTMFVVAVSALLSSCPLSPITACALFQVTSISGRGACLSHPSLHPMCSFTTTRRALPSSGGQFLGAPSSSPSSRASSCPNYRTTGLVHVKVED